MEFLNPWTFLLLIFIPIIWQLKNKKLPFNKEVIKKIVIIQGINKKKRLILYLAAFFFFVLALTRPVSGITTKKIKVSNTDIVILLDGSYNMAKNDIYPNRFDAAINKLQKLFSYLKSQNVALIIVKDYPYLISPFTNDYSSIIYLLKHVNKKQLFNTEANFMLAYNKAKELSKNAIIISISYKPRLGISYVINSQKFQNSINFTYSDEDIKELINEIDKHSDKKVMTLTFTNELFYYPLIIGIVLFFMASFSFRREYA
ncbi:vWA domain-containing protein [Caminibacter sp.]